MRLFPICDVGKYYLDQHNQYTLIPDFKFEKKITKILFSLREMRIKSSSITQLIYRFCNDSYYIAVK